MVQLYINNISVLVKKNTSILEACEELGISIPRFCYHERLNVAGNCRMCLVEVEKTPKPVTSCAFPVVPSMRVYTDTPLVQKARENILEFLLINHPLDCPICDQGGECDLQEQSFAFGLDQSRFFYKKRSVQDKDCGPLIKTIMTRCIHCTRCVRFFQDIVGDVNFGTTLRGQSTEIGSYIKSNFNSELSGNVIDLCPVGALTSKPYAFMARPWEITLTETIDISDSIGSNIRVDTKETEVIRIVPLLNDTLNEEWISDKTRFSFDGLKHQRVTHPYIKSNSTFSKLFNWETVIKAFHSKQRNLKPSNSLIVVGNMLDFETVSFLKRVSQNLGIDLISEQYLNVENKLISNSQFNTNFTDILNSDLCLTVGTNIRFEASLLNVRIKKRAQKGNFTRASIGLTENCNHKNNSIGNSFSTLIKIAEGKHFFCKNLIKSKKPMIIIGTSVKKRLDSSSLNILISRLSKYVNIVDEGWIGLNFLPLNAGSMNNSLTNIRNNSSLELRNKKFVFCIGLDSYSKILKIIPKDTFIVSQTPYSDTLLKNSSLIIPSTSFLEKESTFLNLEGRIQKTAVSLKAPNLALDDSQILKKIFQFNHKNNLNYLNNFEKNNYSFLNKIYFNQKQNFKKFFKVSFKSALSNFFVTNSITKNSLVMFKCFLIFKKNYNNFI